MANLANEPFSIITIIRKGKVAVHACSQSASKEGTFKAIPQKYPLLIDGIGLKYPKYNKRIQVHDLSHYNRPYRGNRDFGLIIAKLRKGTEYSLSKLGLQIKGAWRNKESVRFSVKKERGRFYFNGQELKVSNIMAPEDHATNPDALKVFDRNGEPTGFTIVLEDFEGYFLALCYNGMYVSGISTRIPKNGKTIVLSAPPNIQELFGLSPKAKPKSKSGQKQTMSTPQEQQKGAGSKFLERVLAGLKRNQSVPKTTVDLGEGIDFFMEEPYHNHQIIKVLTPNGAEVLQGTSTKPVGTSGNRVGRRYNRIYFYCPVETGRETFRPEDAVFYVDIRELPVSSEGSLEPYKITVNGIKRIDYDAQMQSRHQFSIKWGRVHLGTGKSSVELSSTKHTKLEKGFTAKVSPTPAGNLILIYHKGKVLSGYRVDVLMASTKDNRFTVCKDGSVQI